jgi:hypothetical protein
VILRDFRVEKVLTLGVDKRRTAVSKKENTVLRIISLASLIYSFSTTRKKSFSISGLKFVKVKVVVSPWDSMLSLISVSKSNRSVEVKTE